MDDVLDTAVSTAPGASESMGIPEWDAYWVSDWLASDQYDNPPPASADPAIEWAHHDPDAWPLIELPDGMDGTQAWQLLESATELALALRFNSVHDAHSGKFASKGGVAVADKGIPTPRRPKVKPITAAEARGDSRPVSADEFQRIAGEGKTMLAERQLNRAPIKGLDDNWSSIKDHSYGEAQKSWGGATIDARTGKAVESHADKYALTIKRPGMSTVSVHETASRDEFNAAMDQAKTRFRPVLEHQGSHLGVFHDDENHRIDIDPVLVVHTHHEVEAIGAYTHAIGGAYHFKSGDGFWPPHVKEE